MISENRNFDERLGVDFLLFGLLNVIIFTSQIELAYVELRL